MPELVPEGPRIPVHLMNEVDEGSVVFFCGAGGFGRGWVESPQLRGARGARLRSEPNRGR